MCGTGLPTRVAIRPPCTLRVERSQIADSAELLTRAHRDVVALRIAFVANPAIGRGQESRFTAFSLVVATSLDVVALVPIGPQ
jgi:hypothetical protein